jgi:hypothetical protein
MLGKYKLESHLKFTELDALVDAAAREADRCGLTLAGLILKMARLEISMAKPEQARMYQVPPLSTDRA